MKNIKKTKYLGKKSKTSSSPDEFNLDHVKNPHTDFNYSIRLTAPEFTSICPITSQPDFGNIIVDYIPRKMIVESKSFKLFLFTFRNYGGFHEDCTLRIAKKIINCIEPKWIRVVSFWNPRGGIPSDVFFQKGKKPSEVYVHDLDLKIYKAR